MTAACGLWGNCVTGDWTRLKLGSLVPWFGEPCMDLVVSTLGGGDGDIMVLLEE
jgi:hypothetical protein